VVTREQVAEPDALSEKPLERHPDLRRRVALISSRIDLLRQRDPQLVGNVSTVAVKVNNRRQSLQRGNQHRYSIETPKSAKLDSVLLT
jgi:hypothetical protein